MDRYVTRDAMVAALQFGPVEVECNVCGMLHVVHPTSKHKCLSDLACFQVNESWRHCMALRCIRGLVYSDWATSILEFKSWLSTLRHAALTFAPGGMLNNMKTNDAKILDESFSDLCSDIFPARMQHLYSLLHSQVLPRGYASAAEADYANTKAEVRITEAVYHGRLGCAEPWLLGLDSRKANRYVARMRLMDLIDLPELNESIHIAIHICSHASKICRHVHESPLIPPHGKARYIEAMWNMVAASAVLPSLQAELVQEAQMLAVD